MSKDLVVRVDSYTNKGGIEKAKYINIGVMLESQNGPYMMLDCTVNLAGILLKQNIMAESQGKPQRKNVMVSIFERDNQQQEQPVAHKSPPLAATAVPNDGVGKQFNPSNTDDLDDGIPF
jgi:hypothetical protein